MSIHWEEVNLAAPRAAETWRHTLHEKGEHNTCLTPDWIAIYRSAYGLETRCFVVPDGDTHALVLPLVRVRSLFSGDQWIALPYVNEAGLWWDQQRLSARDAAHVVEQVQTVLAAPVALRCAPDMTVGGIPAAADKAGFRMPLPTTGEALWQGFRPKLRAQIRRPAKAGYTAHTGGADLLDAFYRVYNENMRDLGSPPHSRKFFEMAFAATGDAGRVIVVKTASGKAAAAAFLIRNGPRIEIPWAASRRAHKRDSPNMLLYERALACGIDMGCAVFDFGRSTAASPQDRFKRQWGAEKQALGWEAFGADGAAWSADKPGRVARTVSALWAHLPLSVTRILGPHLIRRLPV